MKHLANTAAAATALVAAAAFLLLAPAGAPLALAMPGVQSKGEHTSDYETLARAFGYPVGICHRNCADSAFTSPASAVAPSGPRAAPGNRSGVIPGHYIVVFEDSVENPASLARAQVGQRGGKLGFVYPRLNGYSAGNLSRGDAEALRDDPRVKHVDRDREVVVAAQEIPTGIGRVYATQNELADIDGEDVRVGVDVAVIDTGIQYNHSDLNVAGRTNCVPAGEDPKEDPFKECVDGGGIDGNGHGTHVAGTVGALDNGQGVVGVAPGARLWAVRALNNNGSGSFAWIIGAVEWVTATREDEDPENDIDVANMSIGCGLPCVVPAFDEVLSESAEAGVVYAVAAGNDNGDAGESTFGTNPHVITVSALADYDAKPEGESAPSCLNYGADDTLASFSNYGKDVEVAAPGTCIYSTWKNNSYGTTSGTSMASPHVAGAAALRASQDPPEDLEDVEAIRAAIIADGNLEWTDDSPDEVQEPLLDVGRVVTEPPAIESESKVTLHGRVRPGGVQTSYRFEYGETEEYGTSVPVPDEDIGSGSEYVGLSETLESLQGQTTYHYRIAAVYGEEEIIYGQDRAFATTPPTASTGEASEIHGNDAVLNATVNPQGGPTDYWFEYGPTSEYGFKAPALAEDAGSGTEDVEVSQPAGPLIAKETYHFRVVARNVAGTAYGSDETLSTPPPEWFAHLPQATEEAFWLSAISCVAEDDCVVLGNPDNFDYGLVWRLQEGEWSALPDIPEYEEAGGVTQPTDLSCTSVSFCVATGFYTTAPGGGATINRPLIAMWDGTAWQPISTPMPTEAVSGAGRIEGVSCVSTDFCVAAGWFYAEYAGSSSGLLGKPLIERWDGEEWHYETFPNFPKGGSFGHLESVSCTSSSHCLAVGYNEVARWYALALRWDGSEWSVAQQMQPSFDYYTHFQDVSCTSPDACMAVGVSEGRFADHWDGETWTVDYLPVPAGGDGAINSNVSCASAYFCALAGSARGGTPSKTWPVAFAWSGNEWTLQSTGTPSFDEEYTKLNRFHDVECTSSSLCIAVGEASVHAMLAVYPPPDPPAVTTEPASDFTAAAATLHGMVNPNGAKTKYYFEYGPTGAEGYEGKTEEIEVGEGKKEKKVSRRVYGLQLGVTYKYRLVAESEAGTGEGENETFTTKVSTGLALEPPAGFPASFSLTGEPKVSLRGPTTLNCTTQSGVNALGGEGQFEDASSGTATLTLHNCKGPFGVTCTTSGQAAGTIKTEALPFRLVYLSDGEPGLLFLPNAESGAVANASCTFINSIKFAGSGVLGHITKPSLGEASETLTVDLNAPEGSQEYTKTKGGLEYGLTESVNGGAAQPATLEAEMVASFGGNVEVRALRPPTVNTEAASEIKVTEATLNGTVNPEDDETAYQFEYVDQASCQEDVEAQGEGHCFDHATAAPASPEGIGSGTEAVAVKEEVKGLEPETNYHYRVLATSSAGTTYGEAETFMTDAEAEPESGPLLEPPAGFPASFSLTGEPKVSLRGPTTLNCTTQSGVNALGGEGQFEDASSGTATLTLHNCKGPFGVTCTTSGQAAGTIKTEALPFRLVYLSDGEPGLLFLPNAESGAVANASCTFINSIKFAGSGVLGHITKPSLGEASETLTVDLNAPEGSQEYTKTKGGLEYGLTESVNGGAAQPATLEAEAVAGFGGGEVELVEK